MTTMTPMTPEDLAAAQILVQMANGGTQAPADSGSTTDTNRILVQSSDSNAASATNLAVEEGHRPESPPLPQSPVASGPNNHSRSRAESSDTEVSIGKTHWNLIIPEESRTVPVGNVVSRRPGRGRQALNTPATASRVSVQQRAWRLWAMRQLLGEPVGITDEELRLALIESRWDLGTTLRRMNEVLNQARHRHRTDVLNLTSAEQQRDRLLGADSLHHNRRLGIDFLYARLVQVVRVDQRNMLTTLTLDQLLADHRFDGDEAVNAFLERLLHSEEVGHHQRMERRLRMISPNQLHQDQRIARLMEIAGTDDYYGARGLLIMHGYDMLRAMDHWMRHGLAAQRIPPGELTRILFRTPRRLHVDTEDLWPRPHPMAGQLDDIDEDDLAHADADYGDPLYPNRDGWFVRYPREEGRIGINVPTRLRCDYILRGEFTVVQITDVRRRNDTDAREPFDYNKSDHVQRLNSEASEWFRRILGDKTKARGASFHDDENRWIWWWHNERYWELVEEYPDLLNANTAADWQRAGLRWPMRISTDQLARDFNERWAPQTADDGDDDNKRQVRDVRSLDAQRRRIRELCDDFGIPFSPPHKLHQAKRKTLRYSPSVSDVGDDGDDDDDCDPQPPKKKARRPPKTSKSGENKEDKRLQSLDEDVEVEIPENSDNEYESPAELPVKKLTRSTEKDSSRKRKRGQDDEEVSDRDKLASSSSSSEMSNAPRRSGRKRDRM